MVDTLLITMDIHVTTGDMDIWVAIQQENAEKLVDTLREFGFESAQLTADLFMKEDRIVRMGIPPSE